MAGLYAFLSVLGGSLGIVFISHHGLLPTLLAVILLSNLFPLLAAFMLPAMQPARGRRPR